MPIQAQHQQLRRPRGAGGAGRLRNSKDSQGPRTADDSRADPRLAPLPSDYRSPAERLSRIDASCDES